MQVTTTTVSIDGHDIPARRIEHGRRKRQVRPRGILQHMSRGGRFILLPFLSLGVLLNVFGNRE